jgi:hypothetical protein
VVDLQWILDRFLDAGKITAAQDVRLKRAESDITDLKKLYDRVKTLEAAREIADDQERVGPQHRQVFVQSIAVAVAIASVVINVFMYFAAHH